MIARLAAIATVAYLYASLREWRALYLAECVRAIEQQRLLDHERRDVDMLTEKLGKTRVAMDGYVNLAREALKQLGDDKDEQRVELRQRLGVDELVAAVDAVLGVATDPDPPNTNSLVPAWAINDLAHAREALDASAMPVTRREVPDDDLVTERYGFKTTRADALRRYHAERITAAEDGWTTIAETRCPVCKIVDYACVMAPVVHDDATVDHE